LPNGMTKMNCPTKLPNRMTKRNCWLDLIYQIELPNWIADPNWITKLNC
jgi:hypothetical protein